MLQHPRTGEPVYKLAAYQYNRWLDLLRHQYCLTVKSQKIGFTTISLMHDFQLALTRCRGKDILIIAQSLQHAKEHLYTLRKMILGSQRYRPFLITKHTDLLTRDEVTKVGTLFIHNPDNPNRPTRIIGLGPKESSVWSWKEVAHIHMSDVAAVSQVDDSGLFSAAFSRLANTMGSINIESPPRGQRGKVWEIYEKWQRKQLGDKIDVADIATMFDVKLIDYVPAVEAGIITQEFIDAQRIELGAMFGQYYGCEFLSASNTWYTKDMFKSEDFDISW